MTDAMPLVRALRDPGSVAALDGEGWTALIAMARAEQLIGSLAGRLRGLPVPDGVAAILDEARQSAEHGRRVALWEAEMIRRALAPIGCPVVLLKGTAFVAGGLDAGQGRSIGDCDILVPRDRLGAVEAAILAAGWEWVKPDVYDDAYYRRWMHELPPLIHRDRDRMIDIHHTILPPTARPTPDAAALIGGSVALENGLRMLSPADMVVHAAAHLFADGDLAGGLRNLWDVDRLVREFADNNSGFHDALRRAAVNHDLITAVRRALRLANRLYRTPMPHASRSHLLDRWFLRRLLARDGWGRPTRPFTRLAFYVRSHWIRMPPLMLARHLWTKWRGQSVSSAEIRSA
ncbi:hypothetical protein ASE75_04990 [Sphingomonas sp. Leaf17]|uniref:nucleotidyltransferase domain-containing protein n=1 Tax=Sphingomonas sp. Leaf17 TaxID=1735683 RepID=UPI0006F9F346|nr:nucleotidyltransferase family protein [Sphingomonas sp. Leaf17]KQM65611.1 hypothetical protein ASE75_04990 [Sphingomonas sp. Leaf17]